MRRSSARGFTLIEVLVVAAIMALLFGVGIAAYARFDRKRKIETSAMEFATYLRKAQKRADSGDMAINCSSTFEGIKVRAAAGNDFAQDSLDCTNTLMDNKMYLGKDVSFQDNFLVTFRTVSRGVSVVDGDALVSDNFVTARYLIEVTSGGAITVREI